MTIIEKILLEVSAKVDNGKPNFKNKEHIVILSEVLTDLDAKIDVLLMPETFVFALHNYPPKIPKILFNQKY